jgi:subtilase family protein
MPSLSFILCLFCLFIVSPANAARDVDPLECVLLQKADPPGEAGETISQTWHAKLDGQIDIDAKKKLRIFVRFKKQLFRRGGDYETFVEKHRQDKRSRLQPMVQSRLREMSDQSWRRVAPCIQKLEYQGLLGDLQRFWIVNGFAGRATGSACRILAGHDEIEFVYLQRGPARQERVRTPENFYRPRYQRLIRLVYDQATKNRVDDSGERFATDGLNLPWNIKRIRADEVWRREGVYGRGVLVAVNDTGIAAAPALARSLWKNPGEALNGKDDDGNGYVDDLFGYNFRLNTHFVLEPGAHGTACAGIIAGRPLNENRLATGIAPRARVMPLVGMGYLRAYEYALENKADILSLSFMFIRNDLGNYRGVYRLAHEHLSAAGILSVGGAGNFGPGGRLAMPAGKQIATPKDIPCVVATAGITKNGTAPLTSSRGPCTWSGILFYDDYPVNRPLSKPDVTGCFGGYPVWWILPSPDVPSHWKLLSTEARLPFRNVKNNQPLNLVLVKGPSGNSFSGPHAVGVAALMLSANPELNPWEVKAIMEQTSRDLGQPGRDPVYGAGLLDALEAVRAAKKVLK